MFLQNPNTDKWVDYDEHERCVHGFVCSIVLNLQVLQNFSVFMHKKQLHDSVLISLKADILKGGNKNQDEENKAPAATLVVIFHRSCSKSIHSFLKKEGFRNLSSLILRPAVDMITLSRFWDTESYRFWCSAWFVKVLAILDQKNPCSTSFQLEMIMHYKLVIVITVFALLTPWLVSHTILFGSSHDNCGTIYANWVSTVRTGHFPR